MPNCKLLTKYHSSISMKKDELLVWTNVGCNAGIVRRLNNYYNCQSTAASSLPNNFFCLMYTSIVIALLLFLISSLQADNHDKMVSALGLLCTCIYTCKLSH